MLENKDEIEQTVNRCLAFFLAGELPRLVNERSKEQCLKYGRAFLIGAKAEGWHEEDIAQGLMSLFETIQFRDTAVTEA